jgi:hypothetical protein
VTNKIASGLAAHGLSHSWTMRQSEGLIYVTCRVTHELGHFEETQLYGAPDESGGKNAVQAIGSTVTYLQRYTLLAATGLSTTETGAADRDGRNPLPRITEQQAADLLALLTETGANVAQFKKWAKVKELDEILAKNFDFVVAEVRARSQLR